jgi:hypothetical protein
MNSLGLKTWAMMRMLWRSKMVCVRRQSLDFRRAIWKTAPLDSVHREVIFSMYSAKYLSRYSWIQSGHSMNLYANQVFSI